MNGISGRGVFELHRGPLGFHSCKNSRYNGVRLPGLGHSMRGGFEMAAISSSTCSELCSVADCSPSVRGNSSVCASFCSTVIDQFSFFFFLKEDHLRGPIKHDGCLLHSSSDFYFPQILQEKPPQVISEEMKKVKINFKSTGGTAIVIQVSFVQTFCQKTNKLRT